MYQAYRAYYSLKSFLYLFFPVLLLGLLVSDPTDNSTITSDYGQIYIYNIHTFIYIYKIINICVATLCYKSHNTAVLLHMIVHRIISNILICKFNKNYNNNNYTFLRYIYIRLIDFITAYILL